MVGLVVFLLVTGEQSLLLVSLDGFPFRRFCSQSNPEFRIFPERTGFRRHVDLYALPYAIQLIQSVPVRQRAKSVDLK